jgi:hypothetical protein
VALKQVFLQVLRFSLSVSFHQWSRLTSIYMLELTRTSRRNVGILRNECCFENEGAQGKEVISLLIGWGVSVRPMLTCIRKVLGAKAAGTPAVLGELSAGKCLGAISYRSYRSLGQDRFQSFTLVTRRPTGRCGAHRASTASSNGKIQLLLYSIE